MSPTKLRSRVSSPRPADPSPDDHRFLTAFENLQLTALDHRAHVRLGWLYLQRWPFSRALDELRRSLGAFAHDRGKPNLYHETLTGFYLLLIQERMARQGAGHTFEELAEDHPDLFARGAPIEHRYYRHETLDSELARRILVLPDRLDVG